ncbi:MAG: PKD domain-containing protein [Dehalococcoidia bacterium]|nr:MAG: PKD domain-containing protein [Dehalococcoidia bacterium]
MSSPLGQIKVRLSLVALFSGVILGSSCNLIEDALLPNNPPVIDRVTAERWEVEESLSIPIECIASDPDGDELTYTWEAANGHIFGQGSRITWTVPETKGRYIIKVTVTDGRGGVASRESTMLVGESCIPCRKKFLSRSSEAEPIQ